MRETVLLFGPFKLDLRARRLFRDGNLVRLNSKRFEILLLLVEKSGQIVTRDEIIARVWSGQDAGQEKDQAINESLIAQHIFHVRRLLNDDPRSPNYILTIPGTGYLFYQPVRVRHSDGSERLIERRTDLPAPLVSPPAPTTPSDLSRHGKESPLRHSPFEHTKPLTLAAMVVLGVVLAGAGIYYYGSVTRLRESQPAIPTILPLVTTPGIKAGLSFSRDGHRLAFLTRGSTIDSVNIFVRQIESDETIRLTSNPHHEWGITWSPDNQQIAFLRQTNSSGAKFQIVTIPVTGGPEKVVGQAVDGLDWEPAGKYLAISDNDQSGLSTGIHLLSLESGARQPISTPPPNQSIFDQDPKFSPDGREIVFARWQAGANTDLFIANRQTGRVRRLTFDEKSARQPHWTSDGREIVFISDRTGNTLLWRISRDGGEPRAIGSLPAEIDSFSLAPGSQLLAYTKRNEDTNIQMNSLMNSLGPHAGKDLVELGGAGRWRTPCHINSTRADDSPQFAPDGKRLAFISGRSGYDEIWVTDSSCSSAVQLTNFRQRYVGSPRWSPDGRLIAFDRSIDNQSEIFTIEVASGQVVRLTSHPAPDLVPGWSQDGRWIYFTSERTATERIWRMPAEGGEPVPVSRGPGSDVFESPDGRQLYFTRNGHLWWLDLETGTEQIVTELCQQRVGRYWALVNSSIYFMRPETGERSTLCRMELTSRRIVPVLELRGSLARYVPGLTMRGDESLLAISLINHDFSDISLATDWQR